MVDFIKHWFTILAYVLTILSVIVLLIFVVGGIGIGIASLLSSTWTDEFPRWVGHLWGLFSVVTIAAVFTYD